MYGKTVFIIVLCVILAACFICAAVFLIRRKKCIKKVKCMCMPEKIRLLNELAEPFGFSYLQQKDVFIGRIDAWQRAAGYEMLFDKAAAHFHMIIDAWPVYFDYNGKTWLIELWKGQYGISTGAEVGIYHADRILPEADRKWAHYKAADDNEMPMISYCLEKKSKKLFSVSGRHWWLAAFRIGEFSRPGDLKLMVTITFDDIQQAECFYAGLSESGHPRNKFRINCNEVYVQMDFKEKYTCIRKIYYAFIMLLNKICCKLYRFATRPFCNTADRMLFLYFLLPRCFRRMMERKGHGKRRHR